MFLAAALLCRASTAPLIIVAALLLWPGSTQSHDRTGALASKGVVLFLWPVAIAVLIAAVPLASLGAVGGAFQTLTGLRNVPRNTISFLAFQALTGPILIYWMLTRGRRAFAVVAVTIALGIALSFLPSDNLRQYAIPADAVSPATPQRGSMPRARGSGMEQR